MIIIARSTAAGRHDTGIATGSSHLDSRMRSREYLKVELKFLLNSQSQFSMTHLPPKGHKSYFFPVSPTGDQYSNQHLPLPGPQSLVAIS